MYTMTPMYHIYKNRHMKKCKRVMRHIKLISMNWRLFWMHFEVHERDKGAVRVHHDPHVCHTVIQLYRHTGSVRQSYSLVID
jgi:hypothetical protein